MYFYAIWIVNDCYIFLVHYNFHCCSVTSDSSWLHGPQHARLPCPSRSPGVCSSSCPLNHWCYLIISSSVALFSLAFSLSENQHLFQWVSCSHQVPKYWSFSFGISPSSEYSELISFRIDWFDLLSAQGTLKNLLQHHGSKASFFLVLSLLYGPTLTSIYDYWKTTALTIGTFFGKVMSLPFNILSRLS